MRKVFTKDLPPHPIEGTEAFRVYISRPGLRGAASLQRSLTRFFREMSPVKLDAVTVVQINEVLDRLSVKGLNPSYIDKLFRLASAFFSWCRELGYIDSNPFKATRPKRVETIFVPKVVPKEDIAAMHRHIMDRGVVEEIILWGALRMGARISEPCMATIGDVTLDGTKTFEEFMVDPRLRVGTKTSPRMARQPRFTLPAYKRLLEARGTDPEAPLLYLKGVPLKDRKGIDNIEARVLVARTWFQKMQEEILGEYRWTPKAFRSSFISTEIVSDPTKIVALAQQCGNSVKVIQSNYLNYFSMPEFASGED
jgi:integrase